MVRHRRNLSADRRALLVVWSLSVVDIESQVVAGALSLNCGQTSSLDSQSGSEPSAESATGS